MIINTKIELTDDQRDDLANLVDGKTTARKITRAEVNRFVARCTQNWLALCDSPVEAELPVDAAGDLVIPDINAGGWSFIGQEPGR